MDVSKFLRRWLNDRVLAEMPGEAYEGVISEVCEERIRNRFTGAKTLELVLRFQDGWLLAPNLTQKMALVSFWGNDSQDWLGHRLLVFRARVEHVNKETGLLKVRWDKRVALPTAAVRQLRGGQP